jgi:hypothetical protein
MLGKAILYGTITLLVLFAAFTVIPIGFIGGFILAGLIGGFVAGYYTCNPLKGAIAGFASSVLSATIFLILAASIASITGSPIIGIVGVFAAIIAFLSSVISATLTGFIGGFMGIKKCKKKHRLGF